MQIILSSETDEEIKYFKSLRCIVSTGEALNSHTAYKWVEKYKHMELINAYGPAEASDDVSLYRFNKDETYKHSNIPIGKAIDNTHIYIFDDYMKLCPFGVIGQICISGLGLGKGYLNDSEKTKESFVPNPLIKGINEKSFNLIYKTGDYGYLLEDGNIVYSGRKDRQVKINGARIELEEIRKNILEFEFINDAVVNSKNNTLFAYFVTSNEKLDVRELRDFLKEKLPFYMIPSGFMPIEVIPLTSNGKVDWRALPEPEFISQAEYIAPSTATEKQLVSIWNEILKVDEKLIGIHNNFFELGGHSLRAIILVNKIHKEFNIEVSIIEIFKKQSIYEIARYIDVKKWINNDQVKPKENKIKIKI
jgi:acyl-coenzyme A synthetase/AMP-(fatty) acid ligase/acyl carrier protein